MMLLGRDDDVVLVDFGCLKKLEGAADNWVDAAVSKLSDTIEEEAGQQRRTLGSLASASMLSAQSSTASSPEKATPIFDTRVIINHIRDPNPKQEP